MGALEKRGLRGPSKSRLDSVGPPGPLRVLPAIEALGTLRGRVYLRSDFIIGCKEDKMIIKRVKYHT